MLTELPLATNILETVSGHNISYYQGITVRIMHSNSVVLGESDGLNPPFGGGSAVTDYEVFHWGCP